MVDKNDKATVRDAEAIGDVELHAQTHIGAMGSDATSGKKSR